MVGDVHGCSDELDRLVTRSGADRVVLVGDLFTKGPDPAGVWDLVQEHAMTAVLGNHEQRLLEVIDGTRDDLRAAECVAKLDAHDPDWQLWVRGLPLFLEVGGWTVVHAALHPSGDLERTSASVATRLRRWPRDRPTDPRWWQLYEGERRVLFGHDARRGFVLRMRRGEPWLVGLDTGCVYGGALTGWLIERGRSVAVSAARPYRAIKANA